MIEKRPESGRGLKMGSHVWQAYNQIFAKKIT
jgi:hypothetical protein